MVLAGCLSALALPPDALTAQRVERDAGGIFPAGAAVEAIFTDGFFTEGPAMGPDGLLYFSDITFTDPTTHRTVILAGLHDGRRLNSPNDLVLDTAGRIYFTDPRYVGHEPVEQPVPGVYRIDPDGIVTRIIDDAGQPNGVAVSPDGRTLYVASIKDPLRTGFNALLAWDLAGDGSVSNPRILVDFRPDAGPDGMAVDVDGNLYTARPAAEPGVYVYSPAGEELAYLRLPEGPTNAAFGTGAHDRTLFVTAGPNVYAVPTRRAGYHPHPLPAR